MNFYKAINRQKYSSGNFSIVLIRYEDRMDILKWRNEQIYHLRQDKPLTEEDQELYFKTVVNKLFDQEHPKQLLFSYLEDDKCIGYGGLVHINWVDRNAEISFVMNTDLEKDYFSKHWRMFLELIEEIAFTELHLYKIFTYAFDLRPHVYKPIEDSGFSKEATLQRHCLFNEEFKDVIIHAKFNTRDEL